MAENIEINDLTKIRYLEIQKACAFGSTLNTYDETVPEMSLPNDVIEINDLEKIVSDSVGAAYVQFLNECMQFMDKAYANHDPAHGFNHIARVCENAYVILENEPSLANVSRELDDIKQFLTVIMFHDARDHKMDPTKCLSQAELDQFYVCHLGEQRAAQVNHMHANCSWSKRAESKPCWENDWMRKILQDADWLDALGQSGLNRCVAYTEHLGFKGLDVAREVCKHIREKLLLIPAELNYGYSKKMVKDKNLMSPMHGFLATYEKKNGTID